MNKHALALVVAGSLSVTAVNSASANIAIGLSESINGVEGAITTVVSNVANVAVFAGSFGGVGNNDFQLLATGVGSPPLSPACAF